MSSELDTGLERRLKLNLLICVGSGVGPAILVVPYQDQEAEWAPNILGGKGTEQIVYYKVRRLFVTSIAISAKFRTSILSGISSHMD